MLTDEENFLLMKPYCGNPFIAPGELGSKSQHKQFSSFADEGYFMDEETVMPRTTTDTESIRDDDSITTVPSETSYKK